MTGVWLAALEVWMGYEIMDLQCKLKNQWQSCTLHGFIFPIDSFQPGIFTHFEKIQDCFFKEESCQLDLEQRVIY